jgi:hypothetical protein
MAKGPKTAPIIAQNCVFAPLLSAINQRRNAHDVHIIEMINKLAILLILFHFSHDICMRVNCLCRGLCNSHDEGRFVCIISQPTNAGFSFGGYSLYDGAVKIFKKGLLSNLTSA